MNMFVSQCERVINKSATDVNKLFTVYEMHLLRHQVLMTDCVIGIISYFNRKMIYIHVYTIGARSWNEINSSC